MAKSIGPVSELVNNIQASVSGLVNQVLGNSNEPGVPARPKTKEIESVISTLDQSNWLRLSFPYTFSVINIESPGSTTNPFTDFELPLAPQSIKQTEDFAISIRPTQGGTTTTHSGNKYKVLNIKGTTGVHPFKGSGGAQRSTGEAIFQPNELKYKTGYEVFIRLRNWFRAYYEYKKTNPRDAKPLRLVFKNYKDGEFLVCELLKFNMDRQAAKSFMYDYDLEFKVLGHFSFTEQTNESFLAQFDEILGDAVEAIDTARGVFLRTQGILRQVESTYSDVVVEPLRKIGLALKAFQGIGTVAGDIGSRNIRNTVSGAAALGIANTLKTQQKENKVSGSLDSRLASVDLPSDLSSAVANQGSAILDSFGEGLMAIDSAEFPEATQDALEKDKENALALPRSFYEGVIRDLQRVKQNAEDFFNLGSTQYDSIFDRTSTLGASFSKTPTANELDVLNGFNEAVKGIRMLLSTEQLFRSTFDERIQDIVDRFDGNIELFASPAVKEIVLPANTTLERIAQRELGNSQRWGEIVELNNLRAPYIIQDPSDTTQNVVHPGEKLLIPAPLINGFSQVPTGKINSKTRSLSELERSLGVDLKLNEDFDLSLTASGDLDVVAGTDNLAQAVLLKLSYEKGEVIRYPNLGAGIIPGSKFPPLQQIKDGVVNTLLQDTRIQAIEDLVLERDGPALYVSFKVRIKQVDIPVPVKIKVA